LNWLFANVIIIDLLCLSNFLILLALQLVQLLLVELMALAKMKSMM
jgi:hypothetical protein